MSASVDRVARVAAGVALVAAFTLALVAFGGRSLGWVVLATAALSAAAAVLLLGAARGRAPIRGSLLWPALALIALGSLGLPRLPAALVAALSPRRHAIEAAMPGADGGLDRWLAAARGGATSVAIALGDAGEAAALGEGSEEGVGGPAAPARPLPWMTLSFDAPATAVALAVLACWISLILALSPLRETFGLRVLAVICAATAAMAVHAVIWKRIGNGRVFGIFEAPPNVGQVPFGPFWNPNHFAALLAMTCLLAIGAALTVELAARWRLAALAIALASGVGLVDAGSRGGVIGAGAGLCVLGLMLVRARRDRLLGGAFVAAAMLGLFAAAFVFPEKIIDQSLEEAVTVGGRGSNFERSRIYRAELKAVGDAPLVGIGLGAFRTAYPVFQDEPDPLAPLHGESDWLESLTEGGVPLGLAWLALVAALVSPPLRAGWRGRAPIALAGLVAALAAVLIHAAVDFHLREPSVALVAVVVAATAHSWGSRLVEGEASGRLATRSRVATISLALAGLAACIALAPSHVAWDRQMRASESFLAKGKALEARDAAAVATRAAPVRALSWALLAACEEQLAQAARPRERQERRLAALAAAVEALKRSPAALGAARIAGQILLAAGADREALEAARLAVMVAPGQAPTQRLLGQVLLRQGRKAEALSALARAFDATPYEQIHGLAMLLTRMLREAGDADPARIFGAMKGREARIYYLYRLLKDGHDSEVPGYLRLVREEGVDPADADAWAYGLIGGSPEAAELGRALLPNVTTVWARLRIAKALLAAGDPRGRDLLVEVASRDDAPSHAFATLADVLVREGRRDEARATAARGLERHPGDAELVALESSLGK